jgi:hypothetical protein
MVEGGDESQTGKLHHGKDSLSFNSRKTPFIMRGESYYEKAKDGSYHLNKIMKGLVNTMVNERIWTTKKYVPETLKGYGENSKLLGQVYAEMGFDDLSDPHQQLIVERIQKSLVNTISDKMVSKRGNADHELAKRLAGK